MSGIAVTALRNETLKEFCTRVCEIAKLHSVSLTAKFDDVAIEVNPESIPAELERMLVVNANT